eukprot:GHUV01001095.1.p1 GENE.GHUV01001095.1~~GHUV01001095.1.p1  ORF type:complete len:397 (+),score=108.41 GHUV01001095.1:156-1346(+)
MARRLALLCGRASARLFSSSSSSALGVAERAVAINGTKAAIAFSASQLWQTTSVRGFASENESATGYADEFDYVSYPPSRAFVGQTAPDFEAPAVIDGEIRNISLSDYRGKYVVLFWYPKDFTFVCPTEIIAFSDRFKEFEKLNCQVIAASTDTEECHLAWIKTPRNRGGLGYMQIPIVADTTKVIAARYGVLLEKAGIALRGLFIINPEGIVQQITINDLPIGRSVDETLRLLQAIQFHAKYGEVCPANWKPGDKTIIADPDRSMEYFETANKESAGAADDFGAKLTPVHSRRDFEQLIKGDKPVVVDFMAPWCGKCRMIAPFVDELAEKYPDMVFAKFDTSMEQLEPLSAELNVKALPVFRFYKGGQEVVTQVVGYKKKPLEQAVEQLAASAAS